MTKQEILDRVQAAFDVKNPSRLKETLFATRAAASSTVMAHRIAAASSRQA